ncbi:hypothetical protein QYE76_005550 [Lolium multiflorum]|uniref:U-box domain-containing protein n=1 Tax=Lolium multiflorum TaxID=4521 RepID=A0AAD8RT72_LOLMU|nr:hypothetical protein QYE76_005550 [Lolium multiflorum]
MKDPVTVPTGITYDRDSLEGWLARSRATCPVTGAPVRLGDLAPNHATRQPGRARAHAKVPVPADRGGARGRVRRRQARRRGGVRGRGGQGQGARRRPPRRGISSNTGRARAPSTWPVLARVVGREAADAVVFARWPRAA